MLNSRSLLAIGLAVSSIAFALPSSAKSVRAGISLATFAGRCSAAGGETHPRNGGITCILDDGVVIQCYADSDGGINCDIIKVRASAPIVRNILGVISKLPRNTGSRSEQGGQNTGGGQANNGNQGNNGGSTGGMINSGTISVGPTKGSGNGCGGGVC